MATPNITPRSQQNALTLPSTGSVATTFDGAGNVSNYPFGFYVDPASSLYNQHFISGACDQVSFTYKKLGGDVLDVELIPASVYSAYEEAVLEYSYILNLHQAKNSMGSMLGAATGTFNHDGQITNSLSGANANLKYPRLKLSYVDRITNVIAEESGIGGTLTWYSASFTLTQNKQDYDLQQIIITNSANNVEPASNEVPLYAATMNSLTGSGTTKRIVVRRVYYKTPQAMWRFYGYFGGLNVVGNMTNYGQYADDSTFEIIPTWHNKLQAMAYEDHLHTRLSHYTYEIHNNRLRIFPMPDASLISHMWFSFTIDDAVAPWDQVDGYDSGERGINNLNSLPFDNLPYQNINAVGKQWIRRFALALSKETLGLIRSKYDSVPIPNDKVTLNGPDLISQGREDQEKLKEELKEILNELTYAKVAEQDALNIENAQKVNAVIPMSIFQG